MCMSALDVPNPNSVIHIGCKIPLYQFEYESIGFCLQTYMQSVRHKCQSFRVFVCAENNLGLCKRSFTTCLLLNVQYRGFCSGIIRACMCKLTYNNMISQSFSQKGKYNQEHHHCSITLLATKLSHIAQHSSCSKESGREGDGYFYHT